MSQRLMRRAISPCALVSLIAVTTSCSSPTEEPAAAFLGQYYSNQEVVIRDSQMRDPPVLAIRSRAPVTILQGSNAHAVINDGQCLLAADATQPTRLMLRPNAVCERRTEDGLRVVLTFVSGSAELTGRNLLVEARGTFEIPAVDGGPMPPITQGSFTLTVSGVRE